MVIILFTKTSHFTSDKPHYPYELPEGWVWCKLYDIVEFIGGYAYKSNTYVSKSDYQVVRIGNVKNDFLNLENLPVFVPETIGNQTDKYRIYENDILFTMTGTKGKRDYFFTTVVKKQERILLLNQRVGCLRSFSTELNMNYLSMLLKGKYILDSIFSTETGNVSQGNIGSENTLNLFVALPPYVEQQRIVKKVNSFFDLLNVMEERKRNLQDCIHDIKVKILDLAIQGKLIPQDSTDEPACDLLKRINPKAKIISDNGHYQKLPEGWAVCCLENVAEVLDNLRKPINSNERNSRIANKHESELFPYYGATGQVGFIDDYLIDGKFLLLGEDGAPFLDKYAIKSYPIKGKCWVNNHAHILKPLCDFDYLMYYLNHVDYKDYVNGSTRLKLTQSDMRSIKILLPPLTEQKRISVKIKYLFCLLDTIACHL